ncbi:carbohydrate porin [Rubripirellula sp.]|nr:carbohydrate porin [Rubripirellula sp.]
MRSMHLPAVRVVAFFALSALFSSDLRVSGQETVALPQTPLPVRDSGMNEATGRSQDIQQFGGPSSVSGQLIEDSEFRDPEFRCQRLQGHMEPWFDFKRRLDESCGLQLSIDESMFYQAATSSLGETDAAGGLVRVYGQWTLAGQESGNLGQLVFKGENRHRMGSQITPFDLGFEAGSILPTGTFFSEFNYGITNLYWKQYLCDRDLVVAIGKIDVTDFIDVYALMNPLMHFINLGFSTNPTIAVPNQGLGVAAAAMLTNRIYLQGGVADANGQATLAGFDSFFRDHEYFSYAEIGLTSSRDRIYLDNLHATLWHTDARAEAQTPEGWGFAVTAQKFLCEKWLPFFRFGYSEGDAALMQTTLSTGLGLRRENNDVAGAGISFGKPSANGLRDQITSEAFYRFQLTQFLAVTPDVQVIANPALDPNEDVLALFGIRLRAAF